MSEYDCPYNGRRKHHSFKIIRKNCGHGVHGKISVVKSNVDDKEFIWKRPTDKSKIHLNSFKREIEKSKKWRRFGLSRVKICWHSDGKSIIKTLIRGPTLREVLRNHPHFFSNTHDRANKELGKFVRRLIKNRHYIQDLNRANLAYDKREHEWNIIDSSNIQKKRSRHEVASKFKNTFLKHWGTSLESKDKEDLKEFLDRYCR